MERTSISLRRIEKTMDYISCMICLTKFDDKASAPKVLDCGHNLCLTCLANLLQFATEPTCYKCKATISRNYAFPTNFALLRLSKECIKYLVDEEVEKCVFGIKSYMSRMQQELEFSSKNLHLFRTHLTRISSPESPENYKWQWKDIEENPFHEAMVLHRGAYENKIDFLYKIYSTIKNGPVYAIQGLNEKFKCGRIMSHGNKMYIHSVSSPLPEYQKTITYAWFQDLKKCYLDLEVFPFLKIVCNEKGLEATVEIEITGSHLVTQFVKLCTGEMGPSYKGAPYCIGEQINTNVPNLPILHVSGYMSNGSFQPGQLDYTVGFKAPTACNREEYVIYGYEHGHFGISKIETTNVYPSMIGKVIPPCNLTGIISLDGDNYRKIADCGLAFSLQ